MPFVHVEFLEGRSQKQKEALIKDITKVVCQHADVPKERVHVIISDIPHGNYGHGGEIK